MKHIRITVRPNPEHAPEFLAHLLNPSAVSEARAIDWNRGDSELSTHLYGIDGDAATFVRLARETSGIESVSRSDTDGSVSYALIELRDAEVPIFGGSARAIDRTGLVVRRPLVYRDGRIHGHIVGDPETLQATLDQLPDSITVDIDAIQQYPSAEVNPVQSLSERQREAVETALDMGYYETPRAATQDAVAAELGCAANTASEHLRKAEAKLVRAGVDVFNSSL